MSQYHLGEFEEIVLLTVGIPAAAMPAVFLSLKKLSNGCTAR